MDAVDRLALDTDVNRRPARLAERPVLDIVATAEVDALNLAARTHGLAGAELGLDLVPRPVDLILVGQEAGARGPAWLPDGLTAGVEYLADLFLGVGSPPVAALVNDLGRFPGTGSLMVPPPRSGGMGSMMVPPPRSGGIGSMIVPLPRSGGLECTLPEPNA